MTINGTRLAALLALGAALATPWAAAAEMQFHYECRVTGTSRAPRTHRDGHSDEVSQFTCNVQGGILDGFVANGTNILEHQQDRSKLVGSIVVARKGRSSLAYEVTEGTRRVKRSKGQVVGWEATGSGKYKSATGVAEPLVGRSFTSTARSSGPGRFTIDIVVGD